MQDIVVEQRESPGRTEISARRVEEGRPADIVEALNMLGPAVSAAALLELPPGRAIGIKKGRCVFLHSGPV